MIIKNCIKDIVFILKNKVWGMYGKGTRIIKPMRIQGKKDIFLGNNVHILNNVRIEAVSNYNNKLYHCKLEIGDNTSFEQNCHIIAADNLIIGKNCVISAYVYIADCNHIFKKNENALHTDLEIKKTKVGNNCFIGIGAKILPGVTLGNNCIIGANAVVTHDIPENAIACGIPARVIRYLD